MPALWRRFLDTVTKFKNVATDDRKGNGKYPPYGGWDIGITDGNLHLCGARKMYVECSSDREKTVASKVSPWFFLDDCRYPPVALFLDLDVLQLAASKEEKTLGPEKSLLRRQYKWEMSSSFTFIFKMADGADDQTRILDVD
ncbi:hypothetical protein ACROYT_G026757 [Oculina patagonica]